MTDVSAGRARVELGEGVNATCRLTAEGPGEEDKQAESKVNLSSLTSMLEAKWKGGQGGGDAKAEPVRSGQIRSFRITRLDPAAKKIELELA
jgi:small subunit ribosomal protein S1